MKKMILAGALALAALGLFSITATTYADELAGFAAQETASIDIARVKRVLQLTPEQEKFWPPVEAALRDIAHRQGDVEPTGGLVHRISHKVISIALDGAAVGRLARAARPLIERLSDDQKQGALALAQEMGLGPVLAALN